MEKIYAEELSQISGGNDGMGNENWCSAVPNVRTGYLAIRSYPSYDDSNILDEIYPGSVFRINTFRWSGCYVWANFNGTYGWVNADYLTIL